MPQRKKKKRCELEKVREGACVCLYECECVCVSIRVRVCVSVCMWKQGCGYVVDVSVLTTPRRKMIGGMPLGDYQKNLSRWEI